MKVIETYAEAERIPAGKIKRTEDSVIITNDGQSCMALVPRWSNWGRTLEDGTELKEGKTYKVSIEVDEEDEYIKS